jgi:outer membrane protein OmpA-like peptidoglycan-associated protein
MRSPAVKIRMNLPFPNFCPDCDNNRSHVWLLGSLDELCHYGVDSLPISMEYIMIKQTHYTIFPIAAILLAGCAAPAQTEKTSAVTPTSTADQTAAVPEPSVTPDSPGFKAFENGNYAAAIRSFKVADITKPGSPYDELDIGAAYQNSGLFLQAMPYYREAIANGHDVYPAEVTENWAKGLSVEEIACKNIGLGMGISPTAPASTPCETTVVLTVDSSPSPVASSYRQTHYNTYFEFDNSNLTPQGRSVVNQAVQEIRENPSVRATLVGKASKAGSALYNYELSKERVEAVRNAMINAGVPASRIDVRWVGENYLPVAQPDGTREPRNRVVETTIKQSAAN